MNSGGQWKLKVEHEAKLQKTKRRQNQVLEDEAQFWESETNDVNPVEGSQMRIDRYIKLHSVAHMTVS